jgi:hypothetical protein
MAAKRKKASDVVSFTVPLSAKAFGNLKRLQELTGAKTLTETLRLVLTAYLPGRKKKGK